MKKISETKKWDLSFLKNTIYKDKRDLNENALRDIKNSLKLGTSSDLSYYLKKDSKLLQPFNGNESVKRISQGVFADVWRMKNKNGNELIIKTSHDNFIPIEVFNRFRIQVPLFFVNFVFDDYEICVDSLKRDVYDYENFFKPFWGDNRRNVLDENYVNFACNMVDNYVPSFKKEDLSQKTFWDNLIYGKKNPKTLKIIKYFKSLKASSQLIPKEERYVLYDNKFDKLRTIFLQESMIGKDEILPDRYVAYPWELVLEGLIFEEMPMLMLEHFFTTIEAFYYQIKNNIIPMKCPDYRPTEMWKALPPASPQFFVAETNNLVVSKDQTGLLHITYIDTHILYDTETNQIYKWVENRYWSSVFLNIRFWMRKVIDRVK